MASTVQELRRLRQVRRLGELEWFEVAYRAYLVAFVGATALVMLAGLVEDVAPSASQLAEVARRGPAVVGLVPVIAFALGARSGSDGGPVALEAADVHHLLLAPIPRRDVLMRPVVQRLRSAAFTAGAVGAVLGVLAADRLPGSRSAWAMSGGLLGALSGALFVAVAVVTHGLGVPRFVATGIGAAALAWQVAAATDVVGVRSGRHPRPTRDVGLAAGRDRSRGRSGWWPCWSAWPSRWRADWVRLRWSAGPVSWPSCGSRRRCRICGR